MEGLRRVEVLGGQRDLYYGMTVIENLDEKNCFEAIGRIGVGEYFTRDIKVIAHFVYAGLMGGCDRKDEPLEIEYGAVYQWVEQVMVEDAGQSPVFVAAGEAFAESLAVKKAFTNSKKKELVNEE